MIGRVEIWQEVQVAGFELGTSEVQLHHMSIQSAHKAITDNNENKIILVKLTFESKLIMRILVKKNKETKWQLAPVSSTS